MKRKPTWIALALAAALTQMGAAAARADTVVPAPVMAEGLRHDAQFWGFPTEQDNARDAVRSGRVISPGQAKQAALARYPGRYLDMSLAGQTYYVKIITGDNRIVVVSVDAASGRVTGAR